MEAPTYPIVTAATPSALAVHCGDPRFQEPIARFLAAELYLRPGGYVPLVVGGGVASLLAGDLLPEEAGYVRDAIAFYLDRFPSIRRLVLINHEDCGKYGALAERQPLLLAASGGSLATRQRADLVAAARLLAARHCVAAAPYFAAFTDAARTRVRFERQPA